jgi:hypothetical protein
MTPMPSDPDKAKRKRWLRFGLTTLFLIVTFLSGMLAGYRAGFDRGYGSGQQKRTDEQYVTKVYSVSDLILTLDSATNTLAVDFDGLIKTITASTSPDDWSDVGGMGRIEAHFPTLCIVVHQRGSTHREITTLLESLRDERGAGVGVKPPREPQLDGGVF